MIVIQILACVCVAFALGWLRGFTRGIEEQQARHAFLHELERFGNGSTL